jgi:vacuolar iron transporter family protein
MATLEHSHEPAAIRRRLAAEHKPSYLADSILGGIDGCVTTMAVVASVAGAGLPVAVAFVLGLASLVADAFSMGVSNYQAVKSQGDARDRIRRQEERHIDQEPDGERAEVRIIFENKGFEGDTLERIVDTITSDRRRWVDMMIQEEHGMALQGPSPARAGLATFLVFILVGSMPLLPFLLPFLVGVQVFVASGLIAALALFGIGYAKGVVLDMPRGKAGLETLLMGGGASIIAFLFGFFLEPLISNMQIM